MTGKGGMSEGGLVGAQQAQKGREDQITTDSLPAACTTANKGSTSSIISKCSYHVSSGPAAIGGHKKTNDEGSLSGVAHVILFGLLIEQTWRHFPMMCLLYTQSFPYMMLIHEHAAVEWKHIFLILFQTP